MAKRPHLARPQDGHERWIRVRVAAAILGVSTQTLRRWDQSGVLGATKHPTHDYRVYDEREVRALADRSASTPTVEPSVSARPVRRGRERAIIGRDAELARLDSLFASGERLVVVLGPAGIGKTALVDAWVSRRGKPVPYASVGAARSTEDLALAIASACGTVIRAPTTAAIVDQLVTVVGAHDALVLDELENLERDALALVERLASSAPILATTRVRPRLPREHIVVLGPLLVPSSAATAEASESPAVALLLDHARRRGALSELDDAALHEAAAIARRLDGLPLALELAASRAATVGLARLRRELEVSLDALGKTPSGERTLSATVGSSLARLTPAARDTLAAAALLPRGFGLTDLERLVGHDATPELELLLDHAVVFARSGPSAAEPSFDVHAAVREAALAQIDRERLDALEERHALLRAEDAAEWARDRSSEGIRRIGRFEEPFTRAFHWWAARATRPNAAARAVDLARALGRLVEALGPSPGLLDALELAISLGRSHAVDPGLVAEVHFYRGFALVASSRLDEASAAYAEVLSLARGGANARVEALAHCQLAWLGARVGAMAAVAASIDAGLHIATAARDPFAELLLLSIRAQVDLRDRKLATARRGFERTRALSVRLRDLSNEASATGFLGMVAFEEGAIVEAARLHGEAAELAARHPAPFTEAVFAGYRAISLHHIGDEGAEEAYARAITGAERVRSERYASLFSVWRAVLLVSSGRVDEGRRALDAADRLSDPEARKLAEVHRGHVDLAEADRAASEGRIEDVLRHEARACERLLDASHETGGRELRVAVQFLERALRARRERVASASLVVGWRGGWFALPGEARVDLSSRAPLRRLLFRLVIGTLAHEGGAVDAQTLVATGWPGERLSETTARHRLQVALSTLRKLGLGDVVVLDEAGYRLRSTPRIAWSDASPDRA